MIQISFAGTIIGFLSIAGLQSLLFFWLKIRLEKSIQNEYDKALDDYKYSRLHREQAVRISELLAKWIKYGEDSSMLNEIERMNYLEELNKITWELAIWIPDEKLVKKIMSCLAHKDSASNIRELITDSRELVLGQKNIKLKWRDIVAFTSKSKK